MVKGRELAGGALAVAPDDGAGRGGLDIHWWRGFRLGRLVDAMGFEMGGGRRVWCLSWVWRRADLVKRARGCPTCKNLGLGLGLRFLFSDLVVFCK